MLIFPKELRKTALINLFPLENVSEVSYRLRNFDFLFLPVRTTGLGTSEIPFF